MDIQQAAALEMQSKILFDARQQVMQVQATAVPAETPASQNADVILTLSAAAQALKTI